MCLWMDLIGLKLAETFCSYSHTTVVRVCTSAVHGGSRVMNNQQLMLVACFLLGGVVCSGGAWTVLNGPNGSKASIQARGVTFFRVFGVVAAFAFLIAACLGSGYALWQTGKLPLCTASPLL